jgi:hypothetical protein
VPNALGVNICYPEGAGDAGKAVKVTVTTTYRLAVVDGLFNAIGLDGVGDLDLHSSATMRLERRPTANRLNAEVSSCPA